MTKLEIEIRTGHGKVTVRNGNHRARLKRKRTGRVGRQVEKSKRR